MIGDLISIVIPIFNEEGNLVELIDRTLKACQTTDYAFEVILVDDGSSDDSASIIGEATATNREVIGVFLNRNYGQHAAVFAGFEQSQGHVVITIDGDLQNPPEEIPRLIDEIEKGYDVVGTFRKIRNDSLFRRTASAMVNRAVRHVTGVMMSDYGCMLRAYRKPVVKAMLECHEHSTFIPILANSFARNTTEIEVSHDERRSGDSKYGVFKLIALQFDLLTSMSTFPLKILSIIGAAMAIAGFAFAIILLVARILLGSAWAADGIFTLFVPLFFFVGAQFMGLGILGEYIGRIYNDVRSRPRFFVQEVKTFESATSLSK
ncbi:MAG: undecaprenyl-phosphate 4-deoxy-4-formamido-L-arabinose transferase [Desulforhopalus sp.]|jgi:undecaprenyl-phosphate 4-deoxy-4-formamido-L-arabinose transferase